MADDTEMQAINERLVIAAIRQQELAEAAARSAESALKSGHLYRLVARNFPRGMVLLFDHDLRHVLADGGGLAALGLSPEGLEGASLWEQFGPEACRRLEAAYRSALAGETTLLEIQLPAGSAPSEQGSAGRTYQVQTLPALDDRGEILTGMAVAQDITERRRAEEAVHRRAYHDALTGLPNRALLHDRLEQVLVRAERSGEMAALLFLDLDGFKAVNDAWGHAAGDHLLVAVAARLTGCLRAEDTVARVGGDEFVALLPGLHADGDAFGDAAGVARKIEAALAAPINVEGRALSMTASIGISLFPRDGCDAASLTRSADAAMYRVKEDHHADGGPDEDTWPGGSGGPGNDSWYE